MINYNIYIAWFSCWFVKLATLRCKPNVGIIKSVTPTIELHLGRNKLAIPSGKFNIGKNKSNTPSTGLIFGTYELIIAIIGLVNGKRT